MSALGHLALTGVLVGAVLLLDRRSRGTGAVLLAVGLVGTTTLLGSAPAISQAAYDAARAIEDRCVAQPPAVRERRCDEALRARQRCVEDACPAREYHAELSRLGFVIPK